MFSQIATSYFRKGKLINLNSECFVRVAALEHSEKKQC